MSSLILLYGLEGTYAVPRVCLAADYKAALTYLASLAEADISPNHLGLKATFTGFRDGAWVTREAWPSVRQSARSLRLAILDQHRLEGLKRSSEEPDVQVTKRAAVSLNLTTLSGSTLPLRVGRDITIASLKSLSSELDGLPLPPVCEQRLVHAGRPLLSEHLTLADSGLPDGSALDTALVRRAQKPVIYLYPPRDTEVKVQLNLSNEWRFSALYPRPARRTKAEPGGKGESVEWEVRASKDGTIRDKKGLEAAYLFWEAESLPTRLESPPASPVTESLPFNPAFPQRHLTPANGVRVAAGDVPSYLDRVLQSLGLHLEARTSFITCWLPNIQKYAHVALTFLPSRVLAPAAALSVSPDAAILRVFILFSGVEEGQVGVDDPLFQGWKTPEEREVDWKRVIGGDADRMRDESVFRIVEWGGMEVA